MQQANVEYQAGAAATRVGRTLRSKWRLDTLIEVGGMGAVYAATHPDGTRGAVKVAHPNASLVPEVACTFLREGHPNAVRVLDDDVDGDGNMCLVMELLEGETLEEWAEAEGGKLAPDQVLLAVDQLLDGLAAIHEAGIVHRDIKPANVFLTTEGRVKILDFGLASVGGPTASWSAGFARKVMGTPEFMSPEQARGRMDLVDARSDLWSVGATAFTLLSGEHLHTEQGLFELLVATFERPARSLATVLPGAHRALVDLVDRALQLKRADRWPHARGMQAALREAFLGVRGVAW